MEIDEDKLDLVFSALSDRTRRKVLKVLANEGFLRVTELAGYFDMSLNAVSKHIKVLEKAGLVQRKIEGRTHFLECRMEVLHLTDEWIKGYRNHWESRLQKLADILEKE